MAGRVDLTFIYPGNKVPISPLEDSFFSKPGDFMYDSITRAFNENRAFSFATIRVETLLNIAAVTAVSCTLERTEEEPTSSNNQLVITFIDGCDPLTISMPPDAQLDRIRKTFDAANNCKELFPVSNHRDTTFLINPARVCTIEMPLKKQVRLGSVP